MSDPIGNKYKSRCEAAQGRRTPVGTNVNGLSTYALHKDANEYLTNADIHNGKNSIVEALFGIMDIFGW